MGFDPGLQLGDVIDNKQLADIFKCSGQGGMRRSLQTKTLVLVSDNIRSIYENRWSGDIFYYTGMGQQGDQKLDFMQNKTLAESHQNGVDIHLFEVFERGQYTYMGKVKLAKNPFQERQPDANSKLRQVWVFPLRMVMHQPRQPYPKNS